MTDVIERLEQDGLEDPEYLFYCPGCGCCHWFKTTGGSPRWTWNNDFKKPTIQPSILCNASGQGTRCHLFVTDGQLHYLADCDHKFKGQIIDMEPV